MLNFKKVLKFKIFISVFVTVFSYSSAAAYAIRVPMASDEILGLGRFSRTMELLASNDRMTRASFLRVIPMFFVLMPDVLGSGMLPKASAALNSVVVSDKKQEDILLWLSEMGSPEKLRLAIAREIFNLSRSKQIVALFRNKNINVAKLIEDAKNDNPQPLVDFFKDLWNILNQQGYLNPDMPKPVIKLLTGNPDIFDSAKKNLADLLDNKELMRDFAGCTPKSILGYLLSRYFGVAQVQIGLAPQHTFGLMPISGSKYMLADFSIGFFRVIDISQYYNEAQKDKFYYLNLKEKIAMERLFELKRAFKQGGLVSLINDYRITDEELLTLFYPYIAIQDAKGLDFVSCLNRGVMYLQLRDFVKAEKEFKAALALNEKSDEVYVRLGVLYTQLENFSEAENAFRKALELNDKNPELHVNLGVLYARKQDWKRSEQESMESVKLGYVHPVLYSNLGRALYYQGLYDMAINAYSISVILDPNDAQAYFELGASYYGLSISRGKDQRMYQEAVRNFVKAVELAYANSQENGNIFIEALPKDIKEIVKNTAKKVQINSDTRSFVAPFFAYPILSQSI